MNKKLKTPLCYPGGKSRAVHKIREFLQFENVKEYREPFLGGGSMGIYVSVNNPHLKIWVNDKYYNLYIFWKVLRDDVNALQKRLSLWYHTSRSKSEETQHDLETIKKVFYEAREKLKISEDYIDIAASFWLCNKCSFSGMTETGTFSEQSAKQKFSLKQINELSYYSSIIKNWRITNDDYSDLLDNSNDTFIYLDPPYDISSYLYGRKGEHHKRFCHDTFWEQISKINTKCIVSYNNDYGVVEKLKDKGWNEHVFDMTYSMRSTPSYIEKQKERKELLLYKGIKKWTQKSLFTHQVN